jgi:hypothetical protein
MSEIKNLPTYLFLIKRILSPGGKLTLVISNQNNHCPSAIYDFKKELAHNINILSYNKFKIENIHTLHDNFTLYGAFMFNFINHRLINNEYLRVAYYVLIGIPVSVICTIRNCLSYIIKQKKGHCTDALVTLTVDL